MIGIYKIVNILNKKSYYGSSVEIEKRWIRHKKDLKRNKHHNIHLQRAWNKYGEENFIFEIVILCEVDNLLIIEQSYLNKNPKYNIGKGASGGDNISNNPNKNKIAKKISLSMKNRYSNMTKEEIDKIHSKPGNKNYNWKGGISKNYCKCGKKISPNNKTCIKCRDTAKEKNPFYGKKHSKENLEFFSYNQKGICNHDNKISVIIDDIEYETLTDASRKLKINYLTIRWRCLSSNPKFSNYKLGKKINYNKLIIIDDVEYKTLREASEKFNVSERTIKRRIMSKNPRFSNFNYKKSI